MHEHHHPRHIAKQHPTRRGGVAGWALGITLLLALTIGLALALRPRPIAVTTAVVDRGPVVREVEREAVTRVRERHTISSPLTGRLQRITLDPGDAIVAGQSIVAVIEPTDPELLDPRALAQAAARVGAAESALRRAMANEQRAMADLEQATRELERQARASEGGASYAIELDRAQTAQRIAAQEARAAEASADLARYDLELAQAALRFTAGEPPADDTPTLAIVAPIQGRVLRVFQESAAVVAPGTPLLELGDPTDLEIVADVLSTQAVVVEPGHEVIVDHWGGPHPLLAVVRRVEPAAFLKISALGVEEQRVNVIADLLSPAESRPTLGDAYRVTARIITQRHDDARRVPDSALVRLAQDDDAKTKWAVYVVRDGRAVRTEVAVGLRAGRWATILDGPAEGDTVVLYPPDTLTDGARVTSDGHARR